jgi:hypothetical protein
MLFICNSKAERALFFVRVHFSPTGIYCSRFDTATLVARVNFYCPCCWRKSLFLFHAVENYFVNDSQKGIGCSSGPSLIIEIFGRLFCIEVAKKL